MLSLASTPWSPLVAVAYAYKWNAANPDAALKGATAIFGGGIAGMIDPSRGTVYHVLYTLLVLTYSTFCLTSLDTATRMGRFMFQEFWIDGSKGETPENVTGFKKVMANPYVAPGITVVLGILLGRNNKMFLIPMAFMLVVTICSLIINTKTQIGLITKGGADWGPYVQAILGVLLVILAVVLAVEGISTLSKQAKAKAAK